MKIVTPSYFDELAMNEKLKNKLYTAICWSENKITPKFLKDKLDSIRNLEIS